MSAPKRIQRKRTKGWRMPEGAVYVGRGTAYGNPYPIGGRPSTVPGMQAYGPKTREQVVDAFRALFEHAGWERHMPLEPLRGRELACWCPLDQPCHADVLLEIANGATP